MKTTLIILTYNEISGLKALFEKIPVDKVDECFAVDYKSSDGTVEFLQEKRIGVVRQEKRGRGEAFRLGTEKAKGEAVVFFSPDGNEDPNDALKLLNLIQNGYDMAIASRFMKKSINEESEKILPLRSWANQFFTLIANLCFGGHLTDTINGYRAINKESFNKLRVDAEGFAIEYQMSIRAMKLKQKIAEIPTIESGRISGQSTAYSISTGLKILKVFLRELWISNSF